MNFRNTLRWSLLTNRRQYINNALGLTLGLFLIMAIQTGMLAGYASGLIPITEDCCTAYFAVMIVASAVFAAQVCSDLKGKQLRSQYLMLPTSRRNKYWARVLIAFIQGYVVFAGALIAADLLQMLISLVFNSDAYSATKAFFSGIHDFHFSDYYYLEQDGSQVLKNILGCVALLAIAAWGFSSYLLGGVLFRKMPLLMTTVCWIIFWIVSMMVGTTVVLKLLDQLTEGDIEEFNYDMDLASNTIVAVVGILFTIGNMWLSYRKFSRMTISPGRWFN